MKNLYIDRLVNISLDKNQNGSKQPPYFHWSVIVAVNSVNMNN
jgi:hypothetical protein